MTVLENMQAVLPSLPKNERKAAEYLLNYPHDIQRRSAEIIAQDAGISRSAIVRLCQKLGYQGWSEFKYAYLHEPALAASAQEHNILTRYENIIQKLRQGVSADQIQTIVQIIHRANRVITLGNYHSGMSAQQMAFRLNRSGIDSHFMNDTSQMECYFPSSDLMTLYLFFLSAVIRFMNPLWNNMFNEEHRSSSSPCRPVPLSQNLLPRRLCFLSLATSDAIIF